MKLFFLLALAGTATALEASINPIRRVVQMLQSMQKKVEEEGEKDKDLFEEFQCYCKKNDGALEKSISDGETKVETVTQKIEEHMGAQKQLAEELEGHKKDRKEAKAALEEAAALRAKEAKTFQAESGEMKSNIDSIGKALVALRKGAGSSFLQTNAGQNLRKVVQQATLDDVDRDVLTQFLQGQTSGGMGEIIGILSQMEEEMKGDLADAEKREAEALANYNSLQEAKNKEIAAAGSAIEEKTARQGNGAVELVNAKNELKATQDAVEEDKKFLAQLKKNCATAEADFKKRTELRNEEMLALAETVKILNDDDALDLFKGALGFAQKGESLLQITESKDDMKADALDELEKAKAPGWKLQFIQLALNGKKANFDKVLKMIDEMVASLETENRDDEKKRDYCNESIDKTEDENKELKHELNKHQDAVSETEGAIAQLKEDIAALEQGIKDLDKAVAEATKQRKEENEAFKEESQANAMALKVLKFAENRLNKFYNPKLYVPPPPAEMTPEDRIAAANGVDIGGTPAPTGLQAAMASFVQISSESDAAPPPPPKQMTYKKKGEESGGVMAMMGKLMSELQMNIKEDEMTEQDAQEDYEAFMKDSADKRAKDANLVTEKSSAMAEATELLEKSKKARKSTMKQLEEGQKQLRIFHEDCDFLIENFKQRRQARNDQIEAMKNAKAVLNGADYSFMQKSVFLRRHKA